ncbi:MAG: hypothetical protein EP330_15710 [Deltaproteobacteria bacterium]|nr:MAG: hypothetical protein EP330_15710 [Deltaproteobacteria bacterium]
MRLVSTLAILALIACSGGGEEPEDDSGFVAECAAGDSQAGLTACGLNGRGLLDETCSDGLWVDSDTCVDPDECADDDADTDACWEGLGTWDRDCVTGAWQPSSACLLDGAVLASVSSDGTQGDGHVSQIDLSRDGRVVVFETTATNHVAGDTNAQIDVYRHDLETGETTRVSGDGTANGRSTWPSVSGDGRFTVFNSAATNLLGTDANGTGYDVFRHDAEDDSLELVSVTDAGTQNDGTAPEPPSISDDGRYIAFSATSTILPVDSAGSFHVYLRDMDQGTTALISAGGGVAPVISANGRFVAYQIGGFSGARAIVPSAPVQLFVYDSQDASTTQVSLDPSGAEANGSSYVGAVSDEGDVVFYSQATNLVADDTNGVNDLFLYDFATGDITRESLATDGTPGNDHVFESDITPDGSLIVFRSGGTSLSTSVSTWKDNVYLRDVTAGTTTAITDDSVDGSGYSVKISGDGRHLAFQTGSTNLVTSDTNDASDALVMPVP